MTNEEYQQLFPWTEYTFAVRDGRSAVSFGEKPIPLSFKIGGTKFDSWLSETNYPSTLYLSEPGISLTLTYPKPYHERTFLQNAYDSKEGTLSDLGRWSVGTGAVEVLMQDTPTKALKALHEILLDAALKNQKYQRDFVVVSAMLAGG